MSGGERARQVAAGLVIIALLVDLVLNGGRLWRGGPRRCPACRAPMARRHRCDWSREVPT